MFQSTATVHIIKNPKKIKHDTDFLITATTCEELSRYYRYWTKKALYIDLIKASWASHITISKINPTEKFEIASQYDKQKISFSYEPIVRFSGDTTGDKPNRHWFVDVYSDDIREIRRSMDLPDFHKFHITIGILENFS